MASYTTTDFVNSVRQRGSIPTSSNSANVNNTTNLLNLATEELHSTVLPLLMATRAEFYVAATPHDQAITASQAAYPMHTRAVGMILRDVQVIFGSEVRSLKELQPEEVSSTATGPLRGYYLQHNNVILYPTPAATNGTLRQRFYLRPNRLAATTDCAQISAIDTGTNTVTVGSMPSSWAAGTDIDFIAATAPSQCRAIDQDISSISGSDIVFASLPSDLAVGDWIAAADYTPIPQVPFEFQPVLAQATVIKALEALGDEAGVKRAETAFARLQSGALTLVTPRNHGEPKKVVVPRWR